MEKVKRIVKVDITSDIMCPWCIIGYKRFTKAMAKFEAVAEFDLHWHPFELYPRLEDGGKNLFDWLQKKHNMSLKQIIESREKIAAQGKEHGFIFNYNESSRIYNTSLAHQLLHWAGDFNTKQTNLKVALFKAHFTHNLKIDDPVILVEIAKEVGLDAVVATQVLDDKRYYKTIREKERNAKRQGISSIPFYLFDNNFKVEDSQSPTGFEDAIEAVLDS